ncbi:hypothetical protein OEZ85_005693 [Tetradesmus obliquus]|uniref:AtC3H23-like CCCH zinc finger domain-containing protein n=1 Tax=Tetradesmus obliquus TaxID=3088 RepID=A0ABY8UE60_TETOB|nr:hypothetical protein OEZ85_005693 [Tetradesmus obliquus]
MDEGEAGAASSSGAAGEAELQDASAAGGAEQQEQAQQHLQQQQQQAQQLITPIPGARNYGYPDEFMMYAFKVEACNRTDKHPRGSCPYAHPGDVARRRHPSRYQALLCPEVRSKKVCPRMDECQCSHSAFEFWLHPDRYRTSMCEKGQRCSRPVCFFAHTAEELRPLPAGLKPAAPDEAGGSSSSRRGGSGSDGGAAFWQTSGSGMMGQLHPACLPVGLSGGVRYLQQQAAQQQQQQQQVVLPPGMQLVPVAAAGAAAGGGYAPVGYVPVQMQAAVDGSMVAQPAMQYAQASGRYYAPAAVERGGAPVLVMPAGQPQQQQQQQYVLQQAAAQQPPQLPEVVQQFQGLLVSSAPMTPQHQQQQQQQQYVQFGQAPAAGQWQHASGHQQQHGYEQQQQQMVMLMQPGVSGPQSQQQLPYAMQQPQMM